MELLNLKLKQSAIIYDQQKVYSFEKLKAWQESRTLVVILAHDLFYLKKEEVTEIRQQIDSTAALIAGLVK